MDTTNFKYETDILLKEYFATEDEEARRKIVSGIVELNYRPAAWLNASVIAGSGVLITTSPIDLAPKGPAFS